MSINSENVERHTASVVILAGSLATAAIYLLSDYVTIEQTVLVASTPVIVAAFVAVASILYWQSE